MTTVRGSAIDAKSPHRPGRAFIGSNRHRLIHTDHYAFDDVYEVSVSQDAGYQIPVRGNDIWCEGRWREPRRARAAVVRAGGGRPRVVRVPVRAGREAPRAPGELAGPRHHRRRL